MKGQQLSLWPDLPIRPRPGILVDQFSQEYPHYLGIYSRYFPQARRKEILRHCAISIPGAEDGQEWGYSPSSIARAIIEARGGARGPGDRRWEEIAPPWFAPPGEFLPEGILVDIERAFESVLRQWGIRDGAPGRYFSREPLWELPPRFWDGPGEKFVVRILPSCGLEGKIRYMAGPGDIRTVPRPATDRRPWATVIVVLHALAGLAIRMGAIYWNVDGGIFPPASAGEFQEILEEFGLRGREKARGPALILGRGIYAIGQRISLPYRRGAIGWQSSDGEGEFREWAMRVILKQERPLR